MRRFVKIVVIIDKKKVIYKLIGFLCVLGSFRILSERIIVCIKYPYRMATWRRSDERHHSLPTLSYGFEI